jgi:hypothetical protein
MIRTTGGKHRWKRLRYMPIFRGDQALLPDRHTKMAACYQVRADGWRRVKDVVLK